MISPTLNPIVKAINSPDYVLTVEMPLYSKARPRLTRSGHAYMSEAYREAQGLMRASLERQWKEPPLEGPISLYIKAMGEGRGDLDNIAGFLLDAAGPSKKKPGLLWMDDRVSVISSLAIEWEKVQKQRSQWLIHIAVL